MGDGYRFFNRELSWLEFNARVLEEGLDPDNPLLERLKFLAITSSNFDEFFMVRVAALKAALRSGDGRADPSGLLPDEQLRALSKRVREIVGKSYDCLSRDLLPELAQSGLVVARPDSYSSDQLRFLEDYFDKQVFPSLTPLAAGRDSGTDDDSGEGADFPTTGNLRIHAVFSLRSEDPAEREAGNRMAIVQVPHNVEKYIHLPSGDARMHVALLEDVVLAFGHKLFPGHETMDRALFKVTRDADIGVDEERDDDFVAAMEEVLVNRQNSYPVRLMVSGDSDALRDLIRDGLGLVDDDVYEVPGPIDLRAFMDLSGVKGFDRLRFSPTRPAETYEFSDDNTVWDEIRKRDILLHVPYESFSPVERFIEAAATDPSVLAVKMTLYRTSGDSPIVKALTRAARNGKQVTALVELKARFDEERNIAWATRLEQAGAIVVYGVARLKVHAKAIMVVRREEDGSVRRYAHLSTGNYNDKTARLYTDLSLFTVNDDVCHDVALFFNMITGISGRQELKTLGVAPFNMKRRIIAMIDREAQRSTPENPGLIMAKMNALCDVDVIASLYRASARGVQIRLNIRGVCMLVPGLRGISENVMVVSIVGRYLEHSRIFYCKNGGAEEVYLSSADWMPRNLERRIETMFPILDERARSRAKEILEAYFKDTAKARLLSVSGAWRKISDRMGGEAFSAQDYFSELESERSEAGNADMDAELSVRRKLP